MYICGCVKNSGKYIDNVFNNILEIIKLFNNYKVIVAYDESNDNTLNKLNEWQTKIPNVNIIFNNNKSSVRTENISNARNSIINFINNDNDNHNYEYFIMMDFDDVCSKNIDTSIIQKYVNRSDWDCVSFNRTNYYDIWALSFDLYKGSCFQFDHTPSNGNEVVTIMKTEITEKLRNMDKNELLEVYSAFNGFAIYRTNKFINCRYSHLVSDNFKFISRENYNEIINILNNSGKLTRTIDWNNRPSDCEHRHFHFEANYKNNAKICISPLIIFKE